MTELTRADQMRRAEADRDRLSARVFVEYQSGAFDVATLGSALETVEDVHDLRRRKQTISF